MKKASRFEQASLDGHPFSGQRARAGAAASRTRSSSGRATSARRGRAMPPWYQTKVAHDPALRSLSDESCDDLPQRVRCTSLLACDGMQTLLPSSSRSLLLLLAASLAVGCGGDASESPDAATLDAATPDAEPPVPPTIAFVEV